MKNEGDEMTETINVGQKLQKARKSQELTQEQIAEQLGITRQTISNWENNKSYPDIVSLIKLSEIYQVSLDSLLKGDEAMVKHLAKSTDAVASNRQLLLAVGVNIFLLLIFIIFGAWIVKNPYLIFICGALWVTGCGFTLFQVIDLI